MTPHLLIADRDAELCQVYRTFLREYGYEVDTSPDGLNCVQKLRRARPALLVLDLGLHWGGAEGVLAWLREEGHTSQVCVLLTATAGYEGEVPLLLLPPVIRCLRKPFPLTALLETVRCAAPPTIEFSPTRSRESRPRDRWS